MKILTAFLALLLHSCVAIESASIEACDSDNNCLRGTVKFRHPSK